MKLTQTQRERLISEIDDLGMFWRHADKIADIVDRILEDTPERGSGDVLLEDAKLYGLEGHSCHTRLLEEERENEKCTCPLSGWRPYHAYECPLQPLRGHDYCIERKITECEHSSSGTDTIVEDSTN